MRSKRSSGTSTTLPGASNPPTRLTRARSGAAGSAVPQRTARATSSGSNRSARTSSSPSCLVTRSSSDSRIHGTTARQPAPRNAAVTAAPRPPVPPVMSTLCVRSGMPPRRLTRPGLTNPSAASPRVHLMLVRELSDGHEIDQVLLVGAHDPLRLGDRTGAVAAVLADGVADGYEPGTAVRVAARYAAGQLVVHALRPAEPGEYDPHDLLDGPRQSVAQLEADLRELVATVQNAHLRALLDQVLGAAWPQFRDAPAAKRYHQAYRHGLLEHCVGVAQAVSAISATFGGIDRDVAVTGALLHDIGKLDAYTADPLAIDLTDAGKLHGEIALGYYRVRRAIEALPGFPDELAAAVLHIILSHHGTLEHGSPVIPCTREATLVHMIDNLGGKLGSFDRLEKELPEGRTWSAFDRALGGGAWFAPRRAA